MLDNKYPVSENLQILNKISSKILKEALLSGFYDSDFDPLIILDDDWSSYVMQLANLFQQISTRSRERFKESLVWAVNEWEPNVKNSALCLQNLAQLTAYVRASGSVRRLIELYQRGWLSQSREKDGRIIGNERLRSVQSTILIVLTDFMSSSLDVGEFFESLFFFEGTDFRLSPQLFFGLCEYKPSQADQYLDRWRAIIEPNSRWFIERDSVKLTIRNIPATVYSALTTQQKEWLVCYTMKSSQHVEIESDLSTAVAPNRIVRTIRREQHPEMAKQVKEIIASTPLPVTDETYIAAGLESNWQKRRGLYKGNALQRFLETSSAVTTSSAWTS